MSNDIKELHLFFCNRELIQDTLEQGYDAQYIVSSSYMDEWFLFFSDSLVEKLKLEQGLEEIVTLLSGEFYSDSPYIFDSQDIAIKIVNNLQKLEFKSLTDTKEEIESLNDMLKLFGVITKDASEALIGYFP